MRLTLILVAAALTMMITSASHTLKPGVVVDLKGDGSAVVTHFVHLDEVADVVVVKLLGRPEGYVLVYSDEGPLTAEVFSNGSGWFAEVFYPPRSFELTYITFSLANYSQGFWEVTLSHGEVMEVKMPSDVVPTYVPDEVLDIAVEDGRYVVWLPPGSYRLEYALIAEPPEEGGEGAWFIPWLALGVGLGSLATYAAIKVLRRRRLSPSLDDTDKAIVSLIKRKGPLSAAEISQELGIPRSTVHRKLNKLARYGVVRLERAGPKLMAYAD
ncbi:MAG: hypothetical protein DRJ97_01260 [Thermoprotei archaeon]|nr:MAG: hypothetical protein DRJ97_01260 [Thermoprotei archaeon]